MLLLSALNPLGFCNSPLPGLHPILFDIMSFVKSTISIFARTTFGFIFEAVL